ncbi:MAG: cyclase family protein [Terriglobales bacterium]
MTVKTFTVGCALALAIFLFARRPQSPGHAGPGTNAQSSSPQQHAFTKVVDLTHTISASAPTWEGASQSPYSARVVATYKENGYFARDISLPEHFATHIDAPAHFGRGHWTVEKIPPERLVRPLVVLDVSAGAAKNPDYSISVEDVAKWEDANGHMLPGAVVITRTGWENRWNSPRQYRNADAKGVMHFPGYSLLAAQFLVEGRNALGLGIDTLSIDPGQSTDFPVHHYSAEHAVYGIENVANLADLPPAGGLVVVAPIKLEGGSGGPVRILALLP